MPDTYHEPPDELSTPAREFHRAVATMIEEWEAVDWYDQRIDRTTDPELREIIEHLRNEEIEHASMMLEWLRRRRPEVDQQLRTYLFTSGSVIEVEKGAEADGQPTDLGIRKFAKPQ